MLFDFASSSPLRAGAGGRLSRQIPIVLNMSRCDQISDSLVRCTALDGFTNAAVSQRLLARSGLAAGELTRRHLQVRWLARARGPRADGCLSCALTHAPPCPPHTQATWAPLARHAGAAGPACRPAAAVASDGCEPSRAAALAADALVASVASAIAAAAATACTRPRRYHGRFGRV